MATRKTTSGDFENPRPDDGQASQGTDDIAGRGGPSDAGGPSEFETPSGEDALAAESVDTEIEGFLAGVDDRLLAAKAGIEQLLARIGDEAETAQSQAAIDANIVGVGVGLGDGTFDGGVPGDPVLEVYTIERESAGNLRARLASAAGVSALSDEEIPIKTVHTGVIDAHAHRMRLRPAPGGISCGHRSITAGTLGCLVRGRTAPRINRLMILSNNHVLADTNAGPLGVSVLQPGPYDGGKHPADQVAILERYVPISFAAGATNVVDCATAWAWPDRVRRELMHLSGGAPQYFRVGATPVAATLGMTVGKSGRTTQLTSGRVTAVGATINVNYGGGRVARFVNQIAVRAAQGDFSAGGDSGSLIWTWDARRAPVALLFAGGGGTTFGNPIATVLARLDVTIVA